MTPSRTLVVCATTFWLACSIGQAQPGREGHVNYRAFALPFLSPWTSNYDPNVQQWFHTHFSSMVSYSPYADSRLWWWPPTAVYHDLYGIAPGSWAATAHPEWILKDQWGNWLYIPWNCGGGTCPQYAGDVANPYFRAYVIADMQNTLSRANYPGMMIDDTNMEFRVGDGWGNQVPPIDTNTGQLMTWDAWRNYIATFAEQIRWTFPNTTLLENAIWFSTGGTGVFGWDWNTQRLYNTANVINLERAVASDAGLTGGTGFWSVYNFLNFVDYVHNLGKAVNFEEYQLDRTGEEYGLASWFLISNGWDSLTDGSATPAWWFNGYDLDLGYALGARTYSNGIFERSFSGGMVVLAEPGLWGQWINLPTWFERLDGSWVNSIYLQGGQGAVLIGAGAAAAPAPANPAPGGGTHYLSDLTPSYQTNGWGTLGINRSVGGGAISIAGTQYAHGLGTHAYSNVSYWLPSLGGCSNFSATIGIDDEVWWGQGWVQFQVWADGNEIWSSAWMTKGTPAQWISLSVNGVQNLSLVAQYNVTNLYDHADWANPVVSCAR